MSQYRVEVDRRVKKDLQSVPTQDLARIRSALADLANDPRPYGYNPLLSNWGQTLIFRSLKQRKYVQYSESDKRGISNLKGKIVTI